MRAGAAPWLVLAACATAEEEPVSRPASTGAAGASAGSSQAGTAGAGGSANGGGAGGRASGGTAGGVAGSGVDTGGSNSGGSNSGGSASGGPAGSGGSGGSAPPSGDVLFSDDFETSAAAEWYANTTGDWSIVSDGSNAYQQGTLSNHFRVAVAGDAAWTDQVVQARVKVLSFAGGSTSYLVGVYARLTDVDNHYYVALREDGKLALRVRADGSSTTLGSAVDAGIVAGTWYDVRLEVLGSTLNAYLDGELKVTATDSTLTAGAIGLGSTNATAAFDDVVVTVP